jgi:hypothetical protein
MNVTYSLGIMWVTAFYRFDDLLNFAMNLRNIATLSCYLFGIGLIVVLVLNELILMGEE